MKLAFGGFVVLPMLATLVLVTLYILLEVEDGTTKRVSGSGQTATDSFDLSFRSGLAVFTMTHQGDGDFIVELRDQSGASVDTANLANESGPYEGSWAVHTQPGEHVLDVQASGPWTITVDQPRPSSAPRTTSFSGNSKTATDHFGLSGGLKWANMTYEGSGNFIVTLLDKSGTPVQFGTLVNETGPFNGSRAFHVPKEDIYLLRVEASGPWTIEVE